MTVLQGPAVIEGFQLRVSVAPSDDIKWSRRSEGGGRGGEAARGTAGGQAVPLTKFS